MKTWLFGIFLVLLLAGGLVYWRGVPYTLHMLGQAPPVRSLSTTPPERRSTLHKNEQGSAMRSSGGLEGPPSLSVDFMNQVLDFYHSPATGKAQALYDDGVNYGLDPAYALAFFLHESSMGTAGVARTTLSLSNMRCVAIYDCLQEGGGYAKFRSWEQGFLAWFQLIRNLYIATWHLTSLEQIIPVYAPSADHNDPPRYIAAIKHCVATWQAGEMQC